MRVEFTAGDDDDDRRLESVLRRLLPHQSLGALHKALRQGDIRVNGAKASADTRVRSRDTLAVWEGLVSKREFPSPTKPRSNEVLPREWVVFENDDLLVVDKPSGVLVQGGPRDAGVPLDALVRARPASASSLSFRPGPLHRLDRETSGLVVFSKTLVGARTFSAALAGREVSKTYLAVLRGTLESPTQVTQPLTRDEATRQTHVDNEGETATSWFRPLAMAPGLTLVEVDLGTGRTHQIRVHAQSLGLPLAGDKKYGGGPTPAGLDVDWLLHAWKLTGPLLPPLCAPLPPARQAWVQKTFKISP